MKLKIALSLFAVALIPACALTPFQEASFSQSVIDASPADSEVTPFESPGE